MPTTVPPKSPAAAPPESLLRVQDLCKGYVRGGVWRGRVPVAALSGVNFEISRGKTLGLVGQSGSGKSTVARCVTRLERPSSGQIFFDGVNVAQAHSDQLRSFRSSVQMVFQDAVTAMNPRFSALEVVEEPLLINRHPDINAGDGQERRDRVRDLLAEVGIPPDSMHRSILHFSGGQRQRLALARALIIRPQLLVLDETLTGLDLSTQAQIANLLLDLQEVHSLTYLLISHDMALVARLADVIAVMSGGNIVEAGSTLRMTTAPRHATTRHLLASAQDSTTKFAQVARLT